MALWIKICGVTNVEDALAAVDAGADAVGINLVQGSKRRVDLDLARTLAQAVARRAEVVAVVADLGVPELREVRERTGIAWLQLHGAESPETLSAVLPEAYKAIRIENETDVAQAARFAGARLLADSKVRGELGGSGKSFDWALVRELGKKRALVLAGGLHPGNVAEAVRVVRPFGVDTASGVEGADPRQKDHEKMRRFVSAARAAAAGLDTE